MSRFCAVTSAACGRAPSRRVLSGLAVLLGASGLLLLSGCGAKNGLNLGGTPVQSDGISFNGNVHGGQQPVVGATVQFFAVGTGGYATAPTSLLVSPVTTDSNGDFSITSDYTCPAAPADQVFLLATGGNPGGGANPNLALMAALGSCSSLTSSSYVVINEVTTVASAYSLAPFLSYTSGSIDTPPGTTVAALTRPYIGIPTGGPYCNSAGKWTSTGPSTCNYIGIKNAMLTVSNLVNTATGLVPANSKVASYGSSITAGHDSYVPSPRINTLANILSACVNSTGGVSGDGGNCGTLFAATTPSTNVPPTDTLQAILNLAQAPALSATNNTAFWGLAPATPPFNTPLPLTAKPNDWALAMGYTAGGVTNINTGDAGTILPTGAGQATIVNGLAIDQQGNVWATSGADQSGTSNGGNGGLVGLTNLGAPISPNATAANFGGFQTNANLPWADPAIDTAGNLYFGNLNDGSFAAISQSGSNVLSPITPATSVDGGGFYAIAVDSSDHVFVSGYGASGAVAAEYTGSTATWTNTTAASGSASDGYSGISLDNSGNVWFSTISGSHKLSASTGTLVHTFTDNIEGNLAVDSSGNVFGCNSGNVLKLSGTTNAVYNSTGGCYASTNYAPVAIDGLGNLWMPVLGTAEASLEGHLDEVATTGANAGKTISPATYGYQGVGVSGSYGATDGEGAEYLIGNGIFGNQSIAGTAVDGSGNVWVLNGQADLNAASHVFIEFVGMGAPAVTPKALAAQYSSLAALP